MSDLDNVAEVLLEYANLDVNREQRNGAPEIIYCASKSADQIVNIIKAHDKCLEKDTPLLLSRFDKTKRQEVQRKNIPPLRYFEIAKLAVIGDNRKPISDDYRVAVVTAGTSDTPVAEEAAIMLEALGHNIDRIYDAGVAGIHRILSRKTTLQEATVCIVIAGMEGALPSVVAGLTTAPVIAVPTSVGYGASLNGISALLGMLNSCSPGLSVVNIDNGIGAGIFAHKMIRQIIKISTDT